MVRILIVCPICKTSKTINREDIKSEGLTTIQIEKRAICKHNIVLYVDPNGQVRDNINAKIKINKKEMKKADKEERKKEKIEIMKKKLGLPENYEEPSPEDKLRSIL